MALGIEDLAVGHWTDPVGLTGCTVVVPPPGNMAAAAVRGGGPGTRETDLLQPQAHVEGVSAVLLTGGSAFGLAAAQGVVAWCERRGLGYGRFGRPIPIVPAAVLFDLAVGDWEARPGPAEGEAACLAASTAEGPLGNVGAGMGATVGKTAGPEHMTKGGLGWAVVEAGPVTVGALAAVNAGGDVLDEDGTVLAGARVPGGARTALRELLTAPTARRRRGPVRAGPARRQHHPRGGRHQRHPDQGRGPPGGRAGPRRHGQSHPPGPHQLRRRHRVRDRDAARAGGDGPGSLLGRGGARRRHPGRGSGRRAGRRYPGRHGSRRGVACRSTSTAARTAGTSSRRWCRPVAPTTSTARTVARRPAGC